MNLPAATAQCKINKNVENKKNTPLLQLGDALKLHDKNRDMLQVSAVCYQLLFIQCWCWTEAAMSFIYVVILSELVKVFLRWSYFNPSIKSSYRAKQRKIPVPLWPKRQTRTLQSWLRSVFTAKFELCTHKTTVFSAWGICISVNNLCYLLAV